MLYIQSVCLPVASLFAQLVSEAWSEDAAIHLSLRDLDRNFRAVLTGGKLICISTKEGEALVKDLETVLRLVDGDRLNVERKHQDGYDIQAHTTIFCAGRKMPTVQTGGFAAVAHYVARVVLTGDYPGDKNLYQLRNSVQAFVAWGMQGLQRYVEQGHLTDDPGAAIGAEFADLEAFVEQCVRKTPNTDLTLDSFSPLACALRDPFVLIIGNNENYSTLEEFVAYAKENPGKIVMGETGTGAAPTVAITAMENALGIDVTNVTYEGSADCVTAIVGGHIDATFAQACNATAQVEAGNAKIIGVLANDRLAAFPDVPTFAEIYPDDIDFEFMGFCVISCPAGVDASIQEYLSEKLRGGVDSESFANTLSTLGMQTNNMTQSELKDFLQQQLALYGEILGNQ